MAHDLRPDLDQFLPQRRQRPVTNRSGQHRLPQEVAQIIRQPPQAGIATLADACGPAIDAEEIAALVAQVSEFRGQDHLAAAAFRAATDSMQDFNLHDHEDRAMLLPSGHRVVARRSQTCAYATLDPALQQELGLDREEFADATCLLRGAVSSGAHDEVLEHLFAELAATETVYPGTELRLIFQPVRANQIPRVQYF